MLTIGIRLTLVRLLVAVAALAAGLGGAGCASTSMTPFVSPDYDGTRFQTIMVVVDSADLAIKQEIETRAVEDFADHGVKGLRSLDLFFPGRQYSAEETSTIITERQIDAVLIMVRGEAGYSSHYVPKSYHTTSSAYGTATTTGYASGSATRVGNTVYGSASGVSTTQARATGHSTTTESGGYNINKPWARFRVELIDTRTGSVVWTAQGNSGGSGYNDQEDLWQSLSDQTVKTLGKGGLLPR